MTDGKWVHNSCDWDMWHGTSEFDTRDAAIADGREEYEGRKFYVGRVYNVTFEEFAPDLDTILEQTGEAAFEDVGEVCEGWPIVAKAKREHAERDLRNLFREFATVYGLQPTFWRVDNIETVSPAPREGVSE